MGSLAHLPHIVYIKQSNRQTERQTDTTHNKHTSVCCFPSTLLSYSDLQAYARAKKHKTYICKPDSGSQGRGIFLTRSAKDIRPGEHMICQVYLSQVRLLLQLTCGQNAENNRNSKFKTHIQVEFFSYHSEVSC